MSRYGGADRGAFGRAGVPCDVAIHSGRHAYDRVVVSSTWMTRAAVADGFTGFADQLVDLAYEEFDVVAALRGGTGGGQARVVNKLAKNSDRLDRAVVRPELNRYRRQIVRQFEVVLDYAEADDPAPGEFRDRLLGADMYAEALRGSLPGDRRAEVRDALVERCVEMAVAARPLVRSEVDEFWPAVEAELDRETAERLIAEHFSFTGPLRDHEGAFRFAVEVDPGDVLGGIGGLLGGGLPSVEVEFTEEAARVMQTAEREVIDDALAEVERRFDDGAAESG